MGKIYEVYEHHGTRVWVRKDLKGKHRDHCLCFDGCSKFKPGTTDNCKRAALLYALCVALDMTTPVFECPEYDGANSREEESMKVTNMEVVETYWAQIFVGFRPGYAQGWNQLAADELARNIIHGFVEVEGLCVTVTPTNYCYKGGSEDGIIIGLINSPRFPEEPEQIKKKALSLANTLKERLEQNRVSVQFPDETIMLGDKKDND